MYKLIIPPKVEKTLKKLDKHESKKIYNLERKMPDFLTNRNERQKYVRYMSFGYRWNVAFTL